MEEQFSEDSTARNPEPAGQAEHADLSLLQFLQRVCQLNQEPGWCTRCVSSSLVFTLTLPSVQAEVTKGMVLGDRAFGRRFGHEGGTLLGGMRAFMKETPERSLTLVPSEDTGRRTPSTSHLLCLDPGAPSLQI